jgi:hypothetical protein
MIERRVDYIRRKLVSEMSPDEMRQALLVSEKTSLPNKRAFDERDPSAWVATCDVNGLKVLNDGFGYSAGDILIRRLAEVLTSAEVDAYHDKGDKFLCRGGASFLSLPFRIRVHFERSTLYCPLVTAGIRYNVVSTTNFGNLDGGAPEWEYERLEHDRFVAKRYEDDLWLTMTEVDSDRGDMNAEAPPKPVKKSAKRS